MGGNPTVKVHVSKNGVVTFDVENVTGQSCSKLTEVVEIQLGGGGKKSTKPEYHMPDVNRVGNQLVF